VLMLWHAFMFLGLSFFPLFFVLLGGLHCIFLVRFFMYIESNLNRIGALHPRHGPQASPYFLERRVRRRLWPPRVAFSAWPRSFLSLICYVCAQCSASFCCDSDS
jgi:hypothetical protein